LITIRQLETNLKTLSFQSTQQSIKFETKLKTDLSNQFSHFIENQISKRDEMLLDDRLLSMNRKLESCQLKVKKLIMKSYSQTTTQLMLEEKEQEYEKFVNLLEDLREENNSFLKL